MMVSPPSAGQQPVRLSATAKAFVDFGPLAVFLIAYFGGARLAPLIGSLIGAPLAVSAGEEMYLAVGAFLPAFFVAFAYSVWRERRIAPMLLVTGLIVGVLGGLTLFLHDKTFFFMKPTIIYGLFSVALLAGVATGRNFLKLLFDGALKLPETVWRILTFRYAAAFLVLAVSNEAAWRWLTRTCDFASTGVCAGEALWVNLKIFGFTLALLAFSAAQAPLLARHLETPEPEDATGGSSDSPNR